MYGRTLIRTAESSNVGASSYKIGALAKYRCERGFKVVGEPLSTCEDSGQWSGEVPKCVCKCFLGVFNTLRCLLTVIIISVDVDCRNPEKIANGVVTLPSNATYYGALALYACDPNFELDGVSRRLCLENGTWSSDAPICRGTTTLKPNSRSFNFNFYDRNSM